MRRPAGADEAAAAVAHPHASAHAATSVPAAAHTATATEPAAAAHASATTAATPGVGAFDSGSRKDECNRERGCADVSEREH
jgi:hypothetical protein